MKIIFLYFFISIIRAGYIYPSTNNPINIGVISTNVPYVDYSFTMSTDTSIPAFSYIRIKFPMALSTVPNVCNMIYPDFSLGKLFNPMVSLSQSTDVGLPPASTTTSAQSSILQNSTIQIDYCQIDSVDAFTLNIRLIDPLITYTPFQVILNINDKVPTTIASYYFSIKITASTATSSFVFSENPLFGLVPYDNAVPALLSASIKMDYMNKAGFMFNQMIINELCNLTDIIYPNIVLQKNNTALSTLLSNMSQNYSTLDDLSIINMGSLPYKMNLQPNQASFMGSMIVKFTVPISVPPLSLISFQLPQDFTLGNDTVCLSVGDGSATPIPQTSCSVDLTLNYLYLYNLATIPTRTMIQFNITSIQNPMTIPTSPLQISIAIEDPFSATVFAIDQSVGSISVTTGPLTQLSIVPFNLPTAKIFKGSFQYLAIVGLQTESNIIAPAQITITTPIDDATYGPVPGSCAIQYGLQSIQGQPNVSCIITTVGLVGTIIITNFDTIPAYASFMISVLNKNNNKANQNFTMSIYAYPSGSTTLSTSKSFQITTQVTLTPIDFPSTTIMQGIDCSLNWLVDSGEDSLCFQIPYLSTLSGILKIYFTSYITNSFSLGCYTGIINSTTSTSNCSMITNTTSNTIIPALPIQNTVATISIDNTNSGNIVFNAITFAESLKGSDNFFNQYDFYFEFLATGQSIANNGYLLVNLQLPIDDSIFAFIINSGTSSSNLNLLALEGTPILPDQYEDAEVPYFIEYWAYLNPDKFEFYSTTNQPNYPCGDDDIEASYSCSLYFGVSSTTNQNSYLDWNRIVLSGISPGRSLFVLIPFYVKSTNPTLNNGDIKIVFNIINQNQVAFPQAINSIYFVNSTATILTSLSNAISFSNLYIDTPEDFEIHIDLESSNVYVSDEENPFDQCSGFVTLMLAYDINFDSQSSPLQCYDDSSDPVKTIFIPSPYSLNPLKAIISVIVFEISEPIDPYYIPAYICSNVPTPSSLDQPQIITTITDGTGNPLAYYITPPASSVLSPGKIDSLS